MPNIRVSQLCWVGLKRFHKQNLRRDKATNSSVQIPQSSERFSLSRPTAPPHWTFGGLRMIKSISMDVVPQDVTTHEDRPQTHFIFSFSIPRTLSFCNHPQNLPHGDFPCSSTRDSALCVDFSQVSWALSWGCFPSREVCAEAALEKLLCCEILGLVPTCEGWLARRRKCGLVKNMLVSGIRETPGLPLVVPWLGASYLPFQGLARVLISTPGMVLSPLWDTEHGLCDDAFSLAPDAYLSFGLPAFCPQPLCASMLGALPGPHPTFQLLRL